MPISSIVIRMQKKECNEIINQLNGIAAVTVEKIHEDSIVIVTDTKSQKEDKELWSEIESISGILQCDLIYHNFEDDPVII